MPKRSYDPVCTVDGCSKPHDSGGYCGMHAWRVKRYGSTDLPERPAKPCTHEGCSRLAEKRGLCSTHYSAYLRSLHRKEECSFPGCERPLVDVARRLCRGHQNQIQRSRELAPLKEVSPPGTRKPCTQCALPSEARSLCSKHYQRLMSGRPLEPAPLPEFCEFPGCGRPRKALGLCNGHWSQHKRGQELLPIGTRRRRIVLDFVDDAVASRPQGDECWTDWEYGMSNHENPRPYLHVPGKRKVLLARYVFFATQGYWPKWACHRCPLHPNKEDGQCWNPSHIYDGDAQTNGADRRGPKTWSKAKQPPAA